MNSFTLAHVILLMFCIFFIGCGEGQVFDQGSYSANEQFLITEQNKCEECQQLQFQFIDDFALNDEPVPIGLADLSDNKVGACFMYQNGDPAYIKISRVHWSEMSDNSRKALIYHELGHCLLKLGHQDDFDLIKDPDHDIFIVIKLSIMNPTMMTSFQASYVDYYWEEYKLALEREHSIEATIGDEFNLIRDNYYEDIKSLEYEGEFKKDVKKINEELIYSTLFFKRSITTIWCPFFS